MPLCRRFTCRRPATPGMASGAGPGAGPRSVAPLTRFVGAILGARRASLLSFSYRFDSALPLAPSTPVNTEYEYFVQLNQNTILDDVIHAKARGCAAWRSTPSVAAARCHNARLGARSVYYGGHGCGLVLQPLQLPGFSFPPNSLPVLRQTAPRLCSRTRVCLPLVRPPVLARLAARSCRLLLALTQPRLSLSSVASSRSPCDWLTTPLTILRLLAGHGRPRVGPRLCPRRQVGPAHFPDAPLLRRLVLGDCRLRRQGLQGRRKQCLDLLRGAPRPLGSVCLGPLRC